VRTPIAPCRRIPFPAASRIIPAGLLIVCLLCGTVARAQTITLGSKKFTESYVLGEIAKRVLTQAGYTVDHRQGMGGTIILWQALEGGQIDAYPEYTGTITEEILKSKTSLTDQQIRGALAKLGVGMTQELGFNNTYALVMRRKQAEKLNIHTIGDLRQHPTLRLGLTHEFLKRRDGWEPLAARYSLAMTDVRGVEHALGYAALAAGQIDVKDAYSTDAKIAENDLVVLTDNLNFFPQYKAVFLYRLALPDKAVAALNTLAGTIDESRMTRLNAEAERTKDYTRAAMLYFQKGAATTQSAAGMAQRAATAHQRFWSNLQRWTLRHLELVGLSLALSIAVGVPLGIIASRRGILGQLILGGTGIVQTIPALALLALLVPVPGLGISAWTAIVALFLYGLLPIVRNTAAGLQEIPRSLRESAIALGLPPAARLRRIYLPMASGMILTGIKTSAVINVGAATLAALIGAGGLGEPIISGLNLNDNATILQGAIPAALLAIVVQFLFDGVDRLLIPRGLRLAQKKN
jgi:osmoprotectant transport system permease protein